MEQTLYRLSRYHCTMLMAKCCFVTLKAFVVWQIGIILPVSEAEHNELRYMGSSMFWKLYFIEEMSLRNRGKSSCKYEYTQLSKFVYGKHNT